MAENDMLDVEVFGVLCEDKGDFLFSFVGGRRCDGRGPGNARDAVESIFDRRRGKVAVLEIGGHLGCAGVERRIVGAVAVEVEELGVGDRILAR
eukprot:g18250.t1